MCKYCDSASFQEISTTFKYSGIEVCIDKFGDLRVRTNNDNIIDEVEHQIFSYNERFYNYDYDMPVINIPNSEDIVRIKYCPMCGRKFQ